jgi:hypothetical protein
MNNFAFLPSDVLRYVTGFGITATMINVLRCVCKNWKIVLANDALKANHGLEEVHVSGNRVISETFGLRTKSAMFNVCFNKNIIKMIAGCLNLTKLSMSWSRILTDTSMIEVTRVCPSIMELNINRCSNLTDISIIALAHGCPKLTKLNARSCYNITDTSIIEVARSCPGLTELFLYACNKLTDNAIVAVAHGCPKLTTFDVGVVSAH